MSSFVNTSMKYSRLVKDKQKLILYIWVLEFPYFGLLSMFQICINLTKITVKIVINIFGTELKKN